MDESQLYQQAKLTTLRALLQPGEQLLWHGAPNRACASAREIWVKVS